MTGWTSITIICHFLIIGKNSFDKNITCLNLFIYSAKLINYVSFSLFSLLNVIIIKMVRPNDTFININL